MKIRLDRDICTGHGRCYALAPAVFDEDEAGYCVLRIDTVPEALRQSALAAVESCPEQALSVAED